MPLFKTKLEQKLWGLALLVIVFIYATILIGYPLLQFLTNQDLLPFIFSIAMLLCVIAILLHGLGKLLFKNSLAIALILAITCLILVRFELSERTHLIEYSILAIIIHKAFIERYNKTLKAAFSAIILTSVVGCIDEFLQYLVPNRFFDYQDLIFNCLVVISTITISSMLHWLTYKLNYKS